MKRNQLLAHTDHVASLALFPASARSFANDKLCVTAAKSERLAKDETERTEKKESELTTRLTGTYAAAAAAAAKKTTTRTFDSALLCSLFITSLSRVWKRKSKRRGQEGRNNQCAVRNRSHYRSFVQQQQKGSDGGKRYTHGPSFDWFFIVEFHCYHFVLEERKKERKRMRE